MIVIIVFSAKTRGRRVDINIPFLLCYYVSAIGIIISSLFHELGQGFRPFGYYLLLLPLLLFVWEKRHDGEKFRIFVLRAIVIGGLAYIIICVFSTLIGLAPFDFSVRYSGITTNPNSLGLIMAGIILGCFALAYLNLIRSWKLIIYMTMVFAFSILLATRSRTSLIAVICMAVAFFLIKYNRDKNAHSSRISAIKIISLFMIIIAVVAVSDILLNTGLLRINVENNSIDSLSSGRISLWLYCLSMLSIIGHDPQALIDATGLNSAHNIPLDFAFRFGIIVGIAYLCVELMALTNAIRIVFRKKITDASLMFVSLSAIAYFVVSMLEISIMPFEYAVSFCFFIGLGPLMFRHCDERVDCS
jgi:O-antigen ligase